MASVGSTVNASCASIALLQNLQPFCHPCSIFACRCFARFAQEVVILGAKCRLFRAKSRPKSKQQRSSENFPPPTARLPWRPCPSLTFRSRLYPWLCLYSRVFDRLRGPRIGLHPAVDQTNLALKGVPQTTSEWKSVPCPAPRKSSASRTVLARTGLSRSTMYRKIAEGTFPSQVKISVHGAGWRESAINR